MTGSGFVAVKSPSARGWLLIVPVRGQKVKGISPGSFEVLVGSREQEPTGSTNRTAIAASFGHDFNT